MASVSKLGTVSTKQQRITCSTHTMDAEFTFFGGIIVVGNRPNDDVPELRGVKTRIACLHLKVTGPEIRARMRTIASQGYDHAGLLLEPTFRNLRKNRVRIGFETGN